jgi:hypothetical protein
MGSDVIIRERAYRPVNNVSISKMNQNATAIRMPFLAVFEFLAAEVL